MAPILLVLLLSAGCTAAGRSSFRGHGLCKLPHCGLCYFGTCSQCEYGFINFRGSCYSCDYFDESCLKCDSQGCNECASDYALVEGKCVACTELHGSNCSVCSATKCEACSNTLLNGECIDCDTYVEGCTHCPAAVSEEGNLIVNGSFEADEISPDTYELLTSMTGWSLEPNIILFNGIYNPQDQKQFVTTSELPNLSLSQEFDTIEGNEYIVSFYFAPEFTQHAVSIIRVLWDDIEVYTAERVWDEVTVLAWEHHSFTVTATNSQSRLSFADRELAAAWVLDNVSVTPATASSEGCQECFPGYYLADGQCHVCTEAHCQECTEASVCSVCESGFSVDSGKCVEEVAGCEKYDRFGRCSRCRFGRRPFRNRCF